MNGTLWNRAIVPVEHDGATFEPGSLVGPENPAVLAYPDRFEPVRVEHDGAVVRVPGSAVYRQPATPAVLMSDGSVRPIERIPPVKGRAPAPDAALSLPPASPPGRRPWTRAMVAEHWAAAVAATDAPRTHERIAANFRNQQGELYLDPGSVPKLLRKHREPNGPPHNG